MTYLWIGAIVITPAVIFGLIVLKSKVEYPEKSLFYCFLNSCMIPLRLLRLGPFRHGKVSLDKAMKYAMRKTKLTDFGDMTFAESYSFITNTPSHQALKLTNLGHIMFRLELNMSMCRRLRFQQFLKDCPEVLNIRVPTPVFVMGLPRTGTTFLHRLLSLDPQVRAPLLWELLSPVPGHTGAPNATVFADDRLKRNKFVRKLIQDRESMGDRAMEHIHEIGADLPEECLMVLSDEIPTHLSFLYSDYVHHDVFFSKIDFQRVKNAYLYYKKVLQLLSYQVGEAENPRRYMLKCPIHLYYIKELASAFPDAKLIWTHRHPVSAVPSLCSLVKAVHKVYYENNCRDDNAIGRGLTDLTAKTLKQAPQDIIDSKLECSHVIYNDLVSNPIKVVKDIYAQFGWEFTTEYENIIKEYLAEDKKKRDDIKKAKGSKEQLHAYTAEEFGVQTQELMEGEFAAYVKKFNVPMSKN